MNCNCRRCEREHLGEFDGPDDIRVPRWVWVIVLLLFFSWCSTGCGGGSGPTTPDPLPTPTPASFPLIFDGGSPAEHEFARVGWVKVAACLGVPEHYVARVPVRFRPVAVDCGGVASAGCTWFNPVTVEVFDQYVGNPHYVERHEFIHALLSLNKRDPDYGHGSAVWALCRQ